MNTQYKSKITVYADIESVWNSVTQPGFIKNFFPEIKKDLSEMGKYVRATHPNPNEVSPVYAIPQRALGWTSGAGIQIALPRKDVKANIESIDIRLVAKGAKTQIIIETDYSPKLDRNFWFAHRCIRGLINIKLAVLKRNLEADRNNVAWEAALI